MRIKTSARIISVGEVTGKTDKFQKSIIRIECPPLMDGSEVVRDAEQFDCDYVVNNPIELARFNELKEKQTLCTVSLTLRPFWYEEGKTKIKKLGKSLNLRHVESI